MVGRREGCYREALRPAPQRYASCVGFVSARLHAKWRRSDALYCVATRSVSPARTVLVLLDTVSFLLLRRQGTLFRQYCWTLFVLYLHAIRGFSWEILAGWGVGTCKILPHFALMTKNYTPLSLVLFHKLGVEAVTSAADASNTFWALPVGLYIL
jgi:hypothetical protein